MGKTFHVDCSDLPDNRAQVDRVHPEDGLEMVLISRKDCTLIKQVTCVTDLFVSVEADSEDDL